MKIALNIKDLTSFPTSTLSEEENFETFLKKLILHLSKNHRRKIFSFTSIKDMEHIDLLRKVYRSEELWLKQPDDFYQSLDEKEAKKLKKKIKALHLKTHSFPDEQVISISFPEK